MQYMLLIYDQEKAMEGKSQEEMASVMASWFKYTDELEKSGKMSGGGALQPTATATTIRASEGGILASDGPFAETKE